MGLAADGADPPWGPRDWAPELCWDRESDTDGLVSRGASLPRARLDFTSPSLTSPNIYSKTVHACFEMSHSGLATEITKKVSKP